MCSAALRVQQENLDKSCYGLFKIKKSLVLFDVQ